MVKSVKVYINFLFLDAVIVDCFVNSEKSFKNLCKILTISKFQTCPIKLYVDKVHVSYGYDVGANLLLELINKDVRIILKSAKNIAPKC